MKGHIVVMKDKKNNGFYVLIGSSLPVNAMMTTKFNKGGQIT